MTIQDLLDKIAEIKKIVHNDNHEIERLRDIYKICQNIEIDYQIERRLNEPHRESS